MRNHDGSESATTVPFKFRMVRHGLWPVTAAPIFYVGRSQWDAWHVWISAACKFRHGPGYVTAGQRQRDPWQQPNFGAVKVIRDPWLPNNSHLNVWTWTADSNGRFGASRLHLPVTLFAVQNIVTFSCNDFMFRRKALLQLETYSNGEQPSACFVYKFVFVNQKKKKLKQLYGWSKKYTILGTGTGGPG